MEFFSVLDYTDDDFMAVLEGRTLFGDGVLGPLQETLVSEYAAVKSFKVLEISLDIDGSISDMVFDFIYRHPDIRAIGTFRGMEKHVYISRTEDSACMTVVPEEFCELVDKICEHEMSLPFEERADDPIAIKKVPKTVFVPFAKHLRVCGSRTVDLAKDHDVGLFIDHKELCSPGFFDAAVRTSVPETAISADGETEVFVPATDAQAALLTVACSSFLGRAVTVHGTGPVDGCETRDVCVVFPDLTTVRVF